MQIEYKPDMGRDLPPLVTESTPRLGTQLVDHTKNQCKPLKSSGSRDKPTDTLTDVTFLNTKSQ